ncbi:hypothetical protein [Mycoplasma sp. B6188]|uniref:hypothetical protein n=1 Tax=unclassified Mycoplasma TaxID=2683645 RepID=UPI003AADE10C
MNDTNLLVIVDPHNEFGFLDATNFNIQLMLNRHGRNLTDQDLTPIGFRQLCQEFNNEYIIGTYIDGADFIYDSATLNHEAILNQWLSIMPDNAHHFLTNGIQAYYLFIPRELMQRAYEAGIVYDYYTFLDILRDQFAEKNHRDPNDKELINLISSNNGFLLVPTTTLVNFGSRTAESIGAEAEVINKRNDQIETVRKGSKAIWWILTIVLIIMIIVGVVMGTVAG